MKHLSLWSLVVFLALTSVVACNKDDDNDNNNANVVSKNGLVISGAQEKTPVTTNASGTMNVSYDKTAKMLTLNVTWANLSGDPTGAHIHGPAAKGENANVVVDFHENVTSTSGNFNRTVPVDGQAIKEDSLLAGYYYFNIHTQANPGGEIRGQIEF
jgi:hypothetical protein